VSKAGDIWAVVPMKQTSAAKQRLADVLSAPLRQRLAIAMFTDVITVLCASSGLAGIAVVTSDPQISRIARRNGVRILTDGADDGHTGAVTAAARCLDAEGRGAMLTIPGDIPLVTAGEIMTVLESRIAAPCFCIAPSHDRLGSNAVLLSPPLLMPLRFGDDSFRPHVAAARALAIPTRCHNLPGIALDIDTPADLRALRAIRRPTHTQILLDDALQDWPYP
jgi:2-phospho-L-lactate guanylyltransferase